ncbi:MAG: ABC transporter permease [Chloroflexota bacterium]|nr:ABC transporter permease [Chloroflexota bacterium]
MNFVKPRTKTALPVVKPARELPRGTKASRPVKKSRAMRTRGFMALYQGSRSAFQALRANILRSLLTSLGIIIGVGAVIMITSIGEGNAAYINQRLSNLNPNQLTVFAGGKIGGRGASAGTPLTLADADAIGQLPHVSAASPVVGVGGHLIYQNQSYATSVRGVYASYQQVGGWHMQEGAFFSQSDVQQTQAVAVIGQTVADNLFTPLGVDPIGQQMLINGVPFTVVGLLASKGSTGAGSNADDVVYIPVSIAQQRLSGGQHVDSSQSVDTILLLADRIDTVNDVQASLKQLLEQRHHISDPNQDDFSILNQAQVLSSIQSTTQSLTILLVSIAAISLVVGGIGIMNIMLVSVTERTREIGIRIAIGARPFDVMTQFLIEALILSTLGGAVGIGCGLIGAVINAHVTSKPFILDILAVLLAFGFSALVGIVFGFYPAQRASRMDPIVALRAE